MSFCLPLTVQPQKMTIITLTLCVYVIIANVQNADVAHLVERHLAKVEVASPSLVIRSKQLSKRPVCFCGSLEY